MIALDTNVLVRFLVEDDKAQAAAAAALVKRSIAAGEALFVADVVLCEVVWVLEVAYKVPRAVRFLNALPATGAGKVLRRLLRDMA